MSFELRFSGKGRENGWPPYRARYSRSCNSGGFYHAHGKRGFYSRLPVLRQLPFAAVAAAADADCCFDVPRWMSLTQQLLLGSAHDGFARCRNGGPFFQRDGDGTLLRPTLLDGRPAADGMVQSGLLPFDDGVGVCWGQRICSGERQATDSVGVRTRTLRTQSVFLFYLL